VPVFKNLITSIGLKYNQLLFRFGFYILLLKNDREFHDIRLAKFTTRCQDQKRLLGFHDLSGALSIFKTAIIKDDHIVRPETIDGIIDSLQSYSGVRYFNDLEEAAALLNGRQNSIKKKTIPKYFNRMPGTKAARDLYRTRNADEILRSRATNLILRYRARFSRDPSQYRNKINSIKQLFRIDWMNERGPPEWWETDIFWIQAKEMLDLTLGLNVFFPNEGFYMLNQKCKITRHHLHKLISAITLIMMTKEGTLQYELALALTEQHIPKIHKIGAENFRKLAELVNARLWHLRSLMAKSYDENKGFAHYKDFFTKEFQEASVTIEYKALYCRSIKREAILLWEALDPLSIDNFVRRWIQFKKSPAKFYTKNYEDIYEGGIRPSLQDLNNYKMNPGLSNSPEVWWWYSTQYRPFVAFTSLLIDSREFGPYGQPI